MRRNLYLLGLVVLVLLVGCATVNTIPVHSLEPLGMFPFSAIVLDVDQNVAEDAQQQAFDLQIRVVEELNRTAAIPEVRLSHPDVSDDGALLVRVSVEGMRKVSGAARFFLGSFAGKASMTTEVTFLDGSSGEMLGIYQITGKSGGSGMSGGTDDAVVQTADGIVAIICETYGFTPPKPERSSAVEEEF